MDRFHCHTAVMRTTVLCQSYTTTIQTKFLFSVATVIALSATVIAAI